MNLLSERPPVSYTVVVKKGDEVIKYYHFWHSNNILNGHQPEQHQT
jgi:hypothetical protein